MTKNKFNYQDLIDYFDSDIMIREVIHDLRWELEAYYEVYINSRLVRVVFYPDIISPRTVLDRNQFRDLIKKIEDRYKYVKNIYGNKKSF